MNYKQTLDFLFSQLPMYQRIGKAAYKADLNNTIELDKHLGHPHTKYKTIHIAGTNGKGSVSHMLASIFQQAGLKTGLYTSPHLLDFRERIKVNGKMIEKDYVVNFVNDNKDIINKIKPSFFEITVAMAFDYFAKQNVDIAIIETGLGGRLDSTNIITPVLTIITNIGLDHMQFLGDTKQKIALEKAGIIKRNIPVITGEKDPEIQDILLKKAQDTGAMTCFAKRRFYTKIINQTNEYQEIAIKNAQSGTTFNISLDLLGEYQQKNVGTVFASLQVLIPMFNIPKDDIVAALANVKKNTGLRGRWEVIGTSPKVICDTAHNIDGIKEVVNQLQKLQKNTLHIIMGMVDDKDIQNVLKLFPADAEYYFTKAKIPRAMDENSLAEKASLTGLNGKTFSTVKDAYNFALSQAQPNDIIFVGGSTFIVADLLEFVDKQ